MNNATYEHETIVRRIKQTLDHFQVPNYMVYEREEKPQIVVSARQNFIVRVSFMKPGRCKIDIRQNDTKTIKQTISEDVNGIVTAVCTPLVDTMVERFVAEKSL